jgi:hypothetical protein
MSSDNNDPVIERARSTLDWWTLQVERAKEYRARDQFPALCLAVAGIPEGQELEFNAPPRFMFRKVDHPQGEVALARGVKEMTLFGAISRYMRGVNYELAVFLQDGEIETVNEALNYGWLFFTALRIRTNVDFLVPAALDCSWNSLAAYDDHSRLVTLLEDAPKATRKSKPYLVMLEDIQWAAEHVEDLRPHWENTAFRLATECFNTHRNSGNERYAATALWSGIEALFDIEHELRFRLATSIASFLEPRGPARLDLYRKVVKLYDIRSKIVHGANVKPEVISQHLNDASELLARLLMAIVEKDYPTRQMIDELIFSL